MGSVSVAGRIAAVLAVVVAVVVVSLLLFGGGGGGYTVKVQFLNAAQLVKGNLVQVGGTPAGTVEKIEITPEGQAVVTIKVDEKYAPLKQGTKATVRQASLSGIANRYVDLTLPPTPRVGREQREIEEGSTISTAHTTTAVDLDQLFNVFDPATREAVKDLFKNSNVQYAGKQKQQRMAFKYLNPALSTSSRLFNEINADTPTLERFIVDSSELVTALAERRDDLSALIANLNGTFRALGNERDALSQAIGGLPAFMRQANTTFVDLRFALDDVDPLVEASKPVARELQPFLRELRPFARDARPTVKRPEPDRPAPRRRQRPVRPGPDLPAARPERARHAEPHLRRGRRRPRRRPHARRLPGDDRSATRHPRRSSPKPARTPPTCSAGSTTSRTRAATTRSAAGRAPRLSSTL